MSLDITLYEYGPSRSKQARWALLECGLEFKSVSGVGILHSEELNKVNPMGKVPAKVLGGTDYLVGERFSVTDILVGFTLNWGKGAGLLETFPNLQNYLARLQERPHCTL